MIRPIPTINTERLRLRAMRPADFTRFAEIWAMPDVVRCICPPKTRSQAWDSFLRNAGHWVMTGLGQWAIQHHDDDQMIGQTGFFNAARELGEDFDKCPEAGWVLATDVHGAGIGTEAVQAAHDWYDRENTGPLVAMMTPDNVPSRRLAERLGYVLMRQTEYGGDDVILMRREGAPVSR